MRAVPGLAVLFCLALCAPLAIAKAESPPAIAKAKAVPTVLYPLRALGISAEAAAALEQQLRNEVKELPEVQLIAQEAVTASLERERDADCLVRLACAGSAASRAGAKQFVSGTVSGLGDAVLVDLKLVDARSGQELKRITHPITGRQELLIEILHAAVVELLAPERFVGRLMVKLVQVPQSGKGSDAAPVSAADAAGAKLFLDGQIVGTLPLLTPIDGIAPGKRAVRVSKEGFHDASLFVEIRFDRTTEAYVDLPRGELTGVAYLRSDQIATNISPPLVLAPAMSTATAQSLEPRGPWMKIAGWSGVGLGAVSLAVGIALHVKAYQTSSGLSSRLASGKLGPSDVSLYSDVDTEVDAARVLYALAGVFGAGGGALLLWDHHLDQRRLLSASPIVLPEGGGVGVSGKF